MSLFGLLSVCFQFESVCRTYQTSFVMAKIKKQNEPKRKKKSKNAKKAANIKKESASLCQYCGRNFSKASNKQAHIEKDHKGLRWLCAICDKEQVSKHSHLRHYKKCHPGEALVDADANMRYVDGPDQLPEKAKDSVIYNLQEQNKILKTLAMNFRERLLNKIKEIIELKASSGLDIETEKNEYNTLNGAVLSDNENSEISNEDSEKVLDDTEVSKDTSDDDDEQVSSKYPDKISSDDPLKHITKSNSGAGSSRL